MKKKTVSRQASWSKGKSVIIYVDEKQRAKLKAESLRRGNCGMSAVVRQFIDGLPESEL
jgi:hypothetical protein